MKVQSRENPIIAGAHCPEEAFTVELQANVRLPFGALASSNPVGVLSDAWLLLSVRLCAVPVAVWNPSFAVGHRWSCWLPLPVASNGQQWLSRFGRFDIDATGEAPGYVRRLGPGN